MRKTGSRDPRESLEASATSPCSIAVNTFSIRLGSRRNQRPVHQKIRSITTVSPMIDTIKIGHMIGPPLWNLSINQLLPKRPVSAAGEAAGAALAAAAAAGLSAPACAGLNVAVTCAPGAAGCCAAGCPGAAGCCAAGCPGGTFVAGACAAAAGFAGAWAAGFVPAAGGACLGGGDCASEINANAIKDRQVASSVFIIEAGV